MGSLQYRGGNDALAVPHIFAPVKFMNSFNLITGEMLNELLSMIPICLGPKFWTLVTCSNHARLRTLLHLCKGDHKQLTAYLIFKVNRAF